MSSNRAISALLPIEMPEYFRLTNSKPSFGYFEYFYKYGTQHETFIWLKQQPKTADDFYRLAADLISPLPNALLCADVPAAFEESSVKYHATVKRIKDVYALETRVPHASYAREFDAEVTMFDRDWGYIIDEYHKIMHNSSRFIDIENFQSFEFQSAGREQKELIRELGVITARRNAALVQPENKKNLALATAEKEQDETNETAIIGKRNFQQVNTAILSLRLLEDAAFAGHRDAAKMLAPHLQEVCYKGVNIALSKPLSELYDQRAFISHLETRGRYGCYYSIKKKEDVIKLRDILLAEIHQEEMSQFGQLLDDQLNTILEDEINEPGIKENGRSASIATTESDLSSPSGSFFSSPERSPSENFFSSSFRSPPVCDVDEMQTQFTIGLFASNDEEMPLDPPQLVKTPSDEAKAVTFSTVRLR